MSEEEGFLSRWSQRKRATEAEEATGPGPDPGPLGQSEPETAPEPNEAEDEAALLERLNLPVPETLKDGDDFSGFMQAGVPDFLRKRALRVLWRSNPVLANLDGLNDYDEDFNAPELTQKVLATGYQVGRGFVKKVLEGAPDDAEGSSEADAPEELATGEETVETQGENEPVHTSEAEPEVHAEEPPRPRRMRFET